MIVIRVSLRGTGYRRGIVERSCRPGSRTTFRCVGSVGTTEEEGKNWVRVEDFYRVTVKKENFDCRGVQVVDDPDNVSGGNRRPRLRRSGREKY